MSKVKKNILFFLILFLSLLSFSCEPKKSTTTIGELNVLVDEGILPVVKKEASEFMRLNTESKITTQVKTTNEVIADLINGNAKTIVVGRDFSKEENDVIANNKLEIKKNKFALDGIGVIVNNSNPVKKLNFNELKRIFTGETAEWKELDGDNKDLYSGKIKVFITRKNASIHDIFKEKVLSGADFSGKSTICTTSVQMLNEIKGNPEAIGFISMAWITVNADTLDSTVKALKIASVDPSKEYIGSYVGLHQAYIADKTYPLVTESYIMSTDFSMNVSVGLISFMLSYDGQRIVLNSGLVPVTQPVRIIELN
ncbi:MAG TPA: substrate-binding domain-containing protein [Ignavibacteria bacterium]|nr:substrate-binding domain-containing protein [Ignavibacteria bacterium]